MMKTKNKKYTGQILVLMVLLIMVSFTQAQPPGGQRGGEQGPPPLPSEKQIEKIVADLSKELALNESQQHSVSELFAVHFSEMKEVQEKYKDSHEAERQEMDDIKTKFEKEMKTVLTKEQQKKFDAFMKNKRAVPNDKDRRPPKK